MSFKKRHRNRHHKGHSGAKFTQAPRPAENVWVDYERLPRDLEPQALEELLATIPKPKRGKAKEPTSYSELQALSLADLHEIAEEEKLEGVAGKRRDEVIFEITAARLRTGVPVEVEGCVEITRDNHCFVRQADAAYLPANEDVFIPGSIAKQFALLPGMTVKGKLRPPLDGERYFALIELEEVDFHPPEEAATRSPFKELVPLYPEQRIILEGTEDNPLEMRIVDLITPIGRGQRGLIVAPPRTGKTILLQMLAKSIV
jgi:transcription termination factor Rho